MFFFIKLKLIRLVTKKQIKYTVMKIGIELTIISTCINMHCTDITVGENKVYRNI